MTALLHPAASEHLPLFITAPDEIDVLMVVMAVIVALSILMFGILFLRLHTLPERMAHRTHKLQFEIVAVLGLIALFTHQHIFWIAGLLLALIEFPDFSGWFGRIAGSVEKLAGIKPGQGAAELLDDTNITPNEGATEVPPSEVPQRSVARSGKQKELTHA
jgi:multisubunit Na+/H+ antiporter MnhF subunit